jgi:hypothetical protein
MNPRSLLNLFSASDAGERRARAWLATLGLLAALALIAIATSPARIGTAEITIGPSPVGAMDLIR